MKRNLITTEFALNIGKTLSSKNKNLLKYSGSMYFFINISALTHIPEYMYVDKHTDIHIGRG